MRDRNTAVVAASVGSPSPQRIRWGAVFGGAVLGIAFLVLLTSLWFALAHAAGVDEIRNNLEWYIGMSAIGCLFVAGLLAGWLSGVNGAGSGFFNGVTIWGLMVLVTVAIGVPAVLNVLNLGRIAEFDATTGGLLATTDDTVLWATFLSIVGGLLAAGIGGAIGGAVTRPANAHLVPDEIERPARPVRPDVAERDDRTVVVVPETRESDVATRESDEPDRTRV
jgi:hypothetical protein